MMTEPRLFECIKNPDVMYVQCSYKSEHQLIQNMIEKCGATWSARKKAWVMNKSKENLTFCQKFKLNLDKNQNTFSIKTKPYKHQKLLCDYALLHKKVFFLCDVGTGKSKPAIDTITTLFSQNRIKKALIVTPAAVLENFQKEINVHSSLQSVIISGSLEKRKSLLTSTYNVHIINYEMLSKLKDELIDNKYDCIIFDEIHYLKNHKSLRSKAAYQISKDTQYKIGLTGTLIANNYIDAFSPAMIINEKVFGRNFNIFKNKYCVMGGYQVSVKFMGRERKMPTQILGYKNEDEFKTKLSSMSLKFELKDIADLPESVEIIKSFDLTPKTLKLYNDMKRDCVVQKSDNPEDIIFSENHLDLILKLQKISSGFLDNSTDVSTEKLDQVLNILQEISSTEKVVIWCRFTHSIDRLSQYLEKHNISYHIFDGRSKNKTIYKDFNEDNTQVLISQIQKGIGWDIPNCKYSIFYELTYSRTDLVQSKGRTQRPASEHSQNKTYFYIYLLPKNTIDHTLYEVLKTKDFTSKNALEYVGGFEK